MNTFKKGDLVVTNKGMRLGIIIDVHSDLSLRRPYRVYWFKRQAKEWHPAINLKDAPK